MTAGIYAPNGDFISFESARLGGLGGEFATASRAWGFDPATLFGLMPDPDPVLRKRGDDASILEELEGDDEVSTGIEKRVLRTQNKTNFTYTPGHAEGEEPTEAAKDICRRLERDLAKLPLRDLFGEILETVFYGPTFSEIMWEQRGGEYKLVGLVSKPRDWFGFNASRQPVFLSTDAAEGEVLPSGKFVITRHRASYANPYGKRLLTKCLWPVAFKRGGIEFWSRFCEKYGSAFLIARAGKDAQERNIIASQLVSMIQDAVAVLPPGTEVDLAQASAKAGDLHKSYVSFWNRTISKVLTGQHLSTDQDGQGSRAASETHSEQLDALAESDGAMLISSMNELARIYTRVNAGSDVFSPAFGFTEPDDYSEKAELDQKLYRVGVRFRAAHFVNKYGLAEDEFYVEDSPVGTASQPPDSLEFSAPSTEDAQDEYQEAIDCFADELTTKAAKLNHGLTSQIEKIVEQAESVEDLQIMLAELLGQDHGQDEIEELLADAMVNAALAGRAAAHEEHDND